MQKEHLSRVWLAWKSVLEGSSVTKGMQENKRWILHSSMQDGEQGMWLSLSGHTSKTRSKITTRWIHTQRSAVRPTKCRKRFSVFVSFSPSTISPIRQVSSQRLLRRPTRFVDLGACFTWNTVHNAMINAQGWQPVGRKAGVYNNKWFDPNLLLFRFLWGA